MIRALSPQLLMPLVPEEQALRVLGAPGRKALGEKFTLVSWNISKARRRGWLDDLSLLCADADILALQEAVLHGDRPHDFHLNSGFEWVMGQSFAQRWRGRTNGVKTGARVAALSRRMIRSRDNEPLLRLPKAALATTYALKSGAALLVLNIHAVNFVSARKFARQIAQIEEALSAHDGPAIVAGDFNTWNPRRRAILRAAAHDCRLERVPVAAPRWRHLNQVLDHVYYRGVELVQAWAVLNVKSSDHVPLRVEFAQQC
jgi:endonuclease/exonuclease/phosphatase (EEP) superfamily protein YafD